MTNTHRHNNQWVYAADSVCSFEAKMISAEEIARGSRRIASPQFSTVTSTDLSKHAVSSTYLGAVEAFRAEMQEAQRTARREAEQKRKSMLVADRKAELLRASREAQLEQKVKDLNRSFAEFRHFVKNGEIQRYRISCAECGVSVAKGKKLCSDCVEDIQHKVKKKASCDPCGDNVVMQELADAMVNRNVTEAKDASIPSWDPLNAAPMLHWLPTPPEPEVFPRFAGGDKKTVVLGVVLVLSSLLMAGLMVFMGLWWAAPLWLVPSMWIGWLERTDRQAKIQRYYDAIHRRATADWENGRHEVLKEHQS